MPNIELFYFLNLQTKKIILHIKNKFNMYMILS
jgi:hypothetical protein